MRSRDARACVSVIRSISARESAGPRRLQNAESTLIRTERPLSCDETLEAVAHAL